MQSSYLTLVAAMAAHRAIGFDGGMPWHLPSELAHFKETTMGKSILMGRKTWQSIGRALPGRQNIVLTRSTNLDAPGCDVVQTLEQALGIATSKEVMVIGGGELYRLALPVATKMILTLIDLETSSDTWFPDWRVNEWQEISRRSFLADERNPLSYEIVELIRAG